MSLATNHSSNAGELHLRSPWLTELRNFMLSNTVPLPPLDFEPVHPRPRNR